MSPAETETAAMRKHRLRTQASLTKSPNSPHFDTSLGLDVWLKRRHRQPGGKPFTGRGLAHFPGEFARGASFGQEVVQRGSRENVPVPLSYPVNGYPGGKLARIRKKRHGPGTVTPKKCAFPAYFKLQHPQVTADPALRSSLPEPPGATCRGPELRFAECVPWSRPAPPQPLSRSTARGGDPGRSA